MKFAVASFDCISGALTRYERVSDDPRRVLLTHETVTPGRCPAAACPMRNYAKAHEGEHAAGVHPHRVLDFLHFPVEELATQRFLEIINALVVAPSALASGGH